jgi:Sugar phosphate isomerases/epimerases
MIHPLRPSHYTIYAGRREDTIPGSRLARRQRGSYEYEGVRECVQRARKGDAAVNTDLSRREWLSTAALGAALPVSVAQAKEKPAREPFRYCLNTSTIRGQKLKLTEEIEIVARAGYQAIEPWLFEIEQHVKDGGSLKDVGKRLRDRGLEVPSAIGFAEWIVDDEARRKKAFERLKQEMDWLSQLGALRIAPHQQERPTRPI